MQLKRPLGNIFVPYGTPYHVTELFMQVLKITFQNLPEDHPFRYVPDDFEASGVAFDVSLNKESGIRGRKPIVVVSRGTQSTSPQMVGDLAHVRLPVHDKFGSTLAISSINVQVTSLAKAEVEILGQYIFGLAMMCRTHMPALLGVHMVDSITMSEVDKMEDDDSVFVSQIAIQYSTQYKWRQEETYPILRAVGIGMQPPKVE